MMGSANARAQEPATREAAIEAAQAEKAKTLQPYEPDKVERVIGRIDQALAAERRRFHPFFDSAYQGGGFAYGAGYNHFIGPFNAIDVRGSLTRTGYKRAEVAFAAPRLFERRASLSIIAGWREATQVGFFGLGMDVTKASRTNYGFEEPHVTALFTLRPTRRHLLLRGGLEFAKWSIEPGTGESPSIETVYTPSTLPGVGANPTYLHTQGTVGFDWRTSPGYSRRGGFYGITVHDYTDRDEAFGFRQLDYEADPALSDPARSVGDLAPWAGARPRSTRATSRFRSSCFRRSAAARRCADTPAGAFGIETACCSRRSGASWRTGSSIRPCSTTPARSPPSKSDLDFDGLKSDYGFGVRFHGPFTTALRVDLARSAEGTVLVFATGSSF